MTTAGGEESGVDAEAPGDAPDDSLGAGPVDDALTPVDIGRSIIFTANVTVEVPDVFAAGRQAQTAIAGLGGFLYGQETTSEPFARSVLTFKVLPENFSEALNRLGGLGRVLDQSVFADDVTERVVDLESRIVTAETSVARLRELLDAATELEDIVQLEQELLRRETDLEVLRGQLRTLEDQVDLATITLVLTEPVPDDPEPSLELTGTAYIGSDAGAACPGTEELQADEGETVTFCFTLTNTGDTGLVDIELRDHGLDADPKDFIVVEGDLEAVLEPEGRIVLAVEHEVEVDSFTSPAVAAVAVDDEGQPLRVEVVTEIERVTLRVAEDTSLPGFGDSLEASWRALQRVFGVAVVAAGAVVPFLWVPVLLGIALMWRRRRADESAGDGGEEGASPLTGGE